MYKFDVRLCLLVHACLLTHPKMILELLLISLCIWNAWLTWALSCMRQWNGELHHEIATLRRDVNYIQSPLFRAPTVRRQGLARTAGWIKIIHLHCNNIREACRNNMHAVCIILCHLAFAVWVFPYVPLFVILLVLGLEFYPVATIMAVVVWTVVGLYGILWYVLRNEKPHST